MQVLRCAVFIGAVVLGTTAWVGCGDSSDNQAMVKPAVPPEEAQKDSMQAYLKSHPEAAKKAGPGAPK